MIELFKALQAWSEFVADRDARKALLTALKSFAQLMRELRGDAERRRLADGVTAFCEDVRAANAQQQFGDVQLEARMEAGRVTLCKASRGQGFK